MNAMSGQVLVDVERLAQALWSTLGGRIDPTTREVPGQASLWLDDAAKRPAHSRCVQAALSIADSIGWHASVIYQASAEPGVPARVGGHAADVLDAVLRLRQVLDPLACGLSAASAAVTGSGKGVRDGR